MRKGYKSSAGKGQELRVGAPGKNSMCYARSVIIPRAAGTDSHQLSGSKQHELNNSLTVLEVASLPFGDTLRAFHLPWWLEATRAFLLDSSSVSFEGRHLLSLDLLQVLQGLLAFILDLSSPGKHLLPPSKRSGTAEPPEDLL
ncbi:unnamed protein product [Rangifer tarandus platyrhynchus]|uniref:Uncharacterized protein n=2 Tax=Rangifer tarandus platyrhynchus TaxID=3082113 RepID=A0ACB0DVT5_RANTA|nr:unnamed protein product [Rangifer tarandus platyrhynchus]CAI9692274.1 unnamed protein product [Rangifer tarandus platyrhynchus]